MIEQALRRTRAWSRWRGRQGGKVSTSDKVANDESLTLIDFPWKEELASLTFCCRDTVVCVAPDLPVSLFFFDVVYHVNFLAFEARGEAMVAEI